MLQAELYAWDTTSINLLVFNTINIVFDYYY